MNFQKIFISFLISVFILFFIINITYFNKNLSKWNALNIEENYNWFSEVLFSSSWFSIQKVDEKLLDTKKLNIENINFIDRVYFSLGTYKKTQSERNINFELETWIYLFDIYDLSYNYTIKSNWFSLVPKSPWKFFIDNRKQTDVKIFSFDSILSISLLSLDNNEEMTKLVLYPNMFFWFNLVRNKFLKNADLLRIESISRIFYISEYFLKQNKTLNGDFYKKLYFKEELESKTFFENAITLLYSKEEFEKYNIENINIFKVNNLPWIDYINKYFVLFLNKEKKIAYYKKNVLKLLWDFFKKEIKDKNEILENLDKIKNLDKKEYDDFKNILLLYYKNLLKVNSIDYVNNAILLSDIIIGINWNSKTNLLNSSLFLNKIYSINNNTFKESYLQSKLWEYLKYFLDENKIKLKDKMLEIENKHLIFSLDYLSFFLKNIFLYDITFQDKNVLENTFNILDDYVEINEILKIHYNNSLKTETLIIEYNLIIEKILSEIRNSFFEKDLNERWLLVLKSNSWIDSNLVNKLNSVMTKFFNFYNKNKKVLSQKNIIYNDLFLEQNKRYLEYYSALNNYPEYLIKYDKIKKDLFDAKTIFEKEDNIILDKENLINYLSQFEWLDLSQISFKVFKNKYYMINNIFINWDNFSFNLYPLESNRVDNIYKNWEKINFSYELDNIKLDLLELYEKAQDEEKYKYDFKKFFLNTFFSTNTVSTNIFKVNDEIRQEDRTITLFKRDKLFGDTWDFNYLKWFLTINYNDVDVKLVWDKYDIYIKKWILQTKIVSKYWSPVEVIAILDSDYVFSNTEHYFKNIKLKFLDIYYYKNWEEVFLFWWKEFNITKNIEILKFKDEITKEIEKIFLTN